MSQTEVQLIKSDAVKTADIADDQVTLAKLSASGTPSSSTFLRGDNTFSALGGLGKVLQVVQDTRTSQATFTQHSVFETVGGLNVDITPSAATSKVLVMVSITHGFNSNSMFIYQLLRDSTVLLPSTGSAVISGVDYAGTFAGKEDSTRGHPVNFNFLDTPNTTSQINYNLKVMHNSGSYFLNQRDGNYAGSSTIIAIEVGA
tara:strand:- start:242 stop:847 length:606 start_codon:yes stop_codon:yes gene_type:complete